MLFLILGGVSVAFAWAISSILQKHVLTKIRPLTLMFYISAILFTAMLVTSLVYHDITDYNNDIWIILEIVLIIIIEFFFAFLLLFYLIKDNDNGIVTTLSYTTPLFTLILAALFFHEKLNTKTILGVILIVVGSIMISMGLT